MKEKEGEREFAKFGVSFFDYGEPCLMAQNLSCLITEITARLISET